MEYHYGSHAVLNIEYHFVWATKYRYRYFCATSGQITDEMIKSYLEHHFEPNPDEQFKMES